ncbi:Hypothetical protein R9X50_00319200 [Acrodontium crateriforme]|uniref:Uncharacterized protein n=1 Tax=Acrodontium crateriforme TaxID=150365 RepID=A0AAQ3M3V8_9PEZI|nr:Hypothetical protein R9X50_00319200 [Acrodontium crateriforme]
MNTSHIHPISSRSPSFVHSLVRYFQLELLFTMKANFAMAAAFAGAVVAVPQQFDAAQVANAPAPAMTGPPLAAVSAAPYSVDSAAVAASLSTAINQPATAGANQKRWGWPGGCYGYGCHTGSNPTGSSSKPPGPSSSHPASSSAPGYSSPPTYSSGPVTSAPPSSTIPASSTGTVSSTSACPTTPEAGTYCGFINPEDPCSPQPDGYGPKVSPDTPDAFESYYQFHAQALGAVTPYGYESVFKDLNGSVTQNSYLTFYTLHSYNVSQCASLCDNTDLCTAFNIYVERDPSVNPSNNDSTAPTVWGYDCPNPPSITNYKCSLWGSDVSAASATNYGEYREQFHVVIAGSNGYNKGTYTPPPPPNYGKPTSCPNGAVNEGSNEWMGSRFFPGPYDIGMCALYAEAQRQENRAYAKSKNHKSYTPVNMFNSYCVYQGGVAKGTYCALFSKDLGPEKATYSGEGGYTIGQSYVYALSNQDSGLM